MMWLVSLRRSVSLDETVWVGLLCYEWLGGVDCEVNGIWERTAKSMTRFTGTNIRRLDILNCEREQGVAAVKDRTIAVVAG
jgi:hypothetical protein